MHIVRWTDTSEVPWKNGGGVTRELAVVGVDPFEWRLSAATIDRDGPFSVFPGIDRILVLLRGEGIDLEIGGVAGTLSAPGEGTAFAGEAPVDARLRGGPTVDLNLMWRRDRWSAAWSFGDAGDGSSVLEGCSIGAVAIVHVLDGAVRLDDVVLGRGDSAWWDDGALRRVTGSGDIVSFCLSPLD